MSFLVAQCLLSALMVALMAWAMWLGWPWVVAFAGLLLFCVLATPPPNKRKEL
jgi:hypothetical protein